ncbi:sperm-tail PG-rich repeat-containing protein 2-like [Diorhabda carinulata]|uniref:sperm-tail PG-rich repeat-containing protein 2-like n=1 Tax=Diorhabda carinulata TaxID=1163345 RepID=UPI0025A26830|nr:sperm-tail PG-rich repeat-containing protein 2-like [Diorhabda carinulata]
MYNKTNRFGVPIKPQTSSLVGPTTYTVICKSQLKNQVPFLSSAELKSSFFNKSFCDTYYRLPEVKNTLLACSPSYTAPRTSQYGTESPGPAAHEVKPVKCYTQADRIADKQVLRKLYACRVPYTLVGTGPSIPTKINENGYDVGPYGDVTPIPPTDHDTTLGPARYSVVKKSRYDSLYRGIDWSVGKTRREFYNIDSNIPGPAEYNVKIPTCPRDKENDEFREMARLFTYIPRFLDKQDMISRKNNYPGPGDYDITKYESCKRCPPLERTAFFSGTKRFKYKTNDSPAASAYFYKPSKYNVSKLGIPFGVGSSRFPKKKEAPTPSPADYDIKGIIREKLEKNLQYADQKPPFGKSARRVTIEISKDVLNTPSPQLYTIQCVPACKLYTTSTFKSKIARFPKQCRTLEGAPGRYNDMESFNKVKNKKSYNVSKVSFNSKCPKKNIIDKNISNNASPASYETGIRSSNKGFLVPKSPRWKEPKDKFPGPGSYLLHPSYCTGMYNAYKTHNLLLKEDVLKMSLRSHPKTTWAKWASELKKKKKMRWFVNEGKGYIHCHKDLTMYKN